MNDKEIEEIYRNKKIYIDKIKKTMNYNFSEIQEVFAKFLLKLRKIETTNIRDLESYLIRTISNEAKNYIRMKHKQLDENTVSLSLFHEDAFEDKLSKSPESIYNAKLISEVIFDSLDKLSEEEKTLFDYAILEGMKNKDMSEIFEVSDGCLRKRKHELLQRLQIIIIAEAKLKGIYQDTQLRNKSKKIVSK